MKAEIRGEDLMVYCKDSQEIDKFINLNKLECNFNGTFRFNDYTGERTYDLMGEIMHFWFKPEHLPELKFN